MRDTLRAGELGLLSLTAVAGVALLARAGEMIDLPGPRIDAVDGVPLAQREIQVTFGIEVERAWTVEWRSRQRRSVGRRFLLAGSGVGVDHSAFQIDSPDAIVPDIAYQQLALGVEGDA